MKIQTEVRLSAAHKLPNYEGKCSKLHGHDFRVIISIDCDIRDENEFVLDFVKIKEVMSKYDHCYLNDFFENPVAENLAEAFAAEIKKLGIINPICKEGCTCGRDNSLVGTNRFNSVTVKVYESEVSYSETTL
jgi:queuosine biosynthesis protein QueD